MKRKEQRLYRIWQAMRNRCNSMTASAREKQQFKYYGERGIRVCKEWSSFSQFEAWALANGYADNLSIDRINGAGDYEPSNCRWATRKEQSDNRSGFHAVTAFGETKDIAKWSRDPRCAVVRRTLQWRIDHGWEPERALMTPQKDHFDMITAWGETKSRFEWQRDPRARVSDAMIRYRIDAGWLPEKAISTPGKH